ncbi:putative 35 exonuclease helicase [Diaporthe ampelina]|uniref:Putative 35 exonuclease helicase n=1 Tax=Diaporthe ampelina TaxID=1214573 RepID=A0A0G2H5M6_9PEZI|nr:putative 35 exonuclease helicase [Diaporthe ampelina]
MSPTGHRFWSHRLYRGPKDQPRIGLIQIACEDKIALFHIGLHSGSTAKDLLAPALRKIIEDLAIAKCGVAVHDADFARLRFWFGLKPRGALELSHLHNLVSFAASDPAKCTTKLRRLTAQVEQHLGLPLHKGKVRTSNWIEPLSKDQVNYAAADAYAGFMLFHSMNAQRMGMNPTPPLPVYAETYDDAVQPKLPRRRRGMLLQLVPVHGDVEPTNVLHFYKAPGEAVEDQSDVPSAEGGTEPVQHNQAAEDEQTSLPADDTCGYVRIAATRSTGWHITTEADQINIFEGQDSRFNRRAQVS